MNRVIYRSCKPLINYNNYNDNDDDYDNDNDDYDYDNDDYNDYNFGSSSHLFSANLTDLHAIL